MISVFRSPVPVHRPLTCRQEERLLHISFYMKKVLSTVFFCAVLIVALFLFFGEMEDWVTGRLTAEQSKARYAVISSLFLAADIILPIPSSLVMILNGKILGFAPGTLVSFLSGMASSTTGFFLGRKCNSLLNRFFSSGEQLAGNRMFGCYGHAAIAVSKALPILSEAVSVVAGTTDITLRRFLGYSALGHILVSLAYALVGNYAWSMNSSLVAGIVIAASLLFVWAVGKFAGRTLASPDRDYL